MAIKLQFSDLYQRVSAYLGTGSAPIGQALTDAKQLVNDAYRNFLNAHLWTFTRFTADAGISTTSGTVNVAMPSDFSSLSTGFSLDSGGQVMSLVSEQTVREYNAFNPANAKPYLYTIRATGPNSGYEALFAPVPDAAYDISFTYIQIQPLLVNDTDVAAGANTHSETLLEGCLALAEQRKNDSMELHTKLYEVLLARSIAFDKTLPGAALTVTPLDMKRTSVTDGLATDAEAGSSGQ